MIAHNRHNLSNLDTQGRQRQREGDREREIERERDGGNLREDVLKKTRMRDPAAVMRRNAIRAGASLSLSLFSSFPFCTVFSIGSVVRWDNYAWHDEANSADGNTSVTMSGIIPGWPTGRR